ncbi:hypothetical protein PIB30_085728 [Stylosanthes scabra]|uniref:Uncharacterized protein n=1 Tax=Stylosanthes scabra TaxID=79078 RepID=A0ABU6ZS90_9FABA|nr:hypothetical protein [Stylosanthes scabra]
MITLRKLLREWIVDCRPCGGLGLKWAASGGRSMVIVAFMGLLVWACVVKKSFEDQLSERQRSWGQVHPPSFLEELKYISCVRIEAELYLSCPSTSSPFEGAHQLIPKLTEL